MPQDKQADRKARRLLVAAKKATAHKSPGSWVMTYDVADSLGLNDVDDACNGCKVRCADRNARTDLGQHLGCLKRRTFSGLPKQSPLPPSLQSSRS